MSKCESCFHQEENHQSSICNGDLTCICQKFVEPELVEWALEVEQYKKQNLTCESRVEYLLRKFPHLINVNDRTLDKVYKAVWHGFWPSSKTIYSQERFKELPLDSTIERAKRFVKARHPELQTSDPNLLRHQEARLTAYMELAIGK